MQFFLPFDFYCALGRPECVGDVFLKMGKTLIWGRQYPLPFENLLSETSAYINIVQLFFLQKAKYCGAQGKMTKTFFVILLRSTSNSIPKI